MELYNVIANYDKSGTMAISSANVLAEDQTRINIFKTVYLQFHKSWYGD